MKEFSVLVQIGTLFWWALMLTCGLAEREYFHQSRNLNWDEARNHCQVCFKELVSVTPENTHIISQNLTTDYWIGLRKNFYPTAHPNVSWSRWANGDPLAFQNWHPGWPVSEPSLPVGYCCSCSCTCPAQPATSMWDLYNSTDGLSAYNTTDAPVKSPAECVRSPMPTPEIPEDSCVVMLSFGLWVEKNCTDHRPFICYEDRFFGKVTVTSVTPDSAVLAWRHGPGNISHWRLEVGGQTHNLKALTYKVNNLTPGTRYSPHVFPVKCNRDLNPQVENFYTIPNEVKNLNYANVTERSVFLSWSRPAGNVDLYQIEGRGEPTETNATEIEMDRLTPGKLYTFSVRSGVHDKSVWSNTSTISLYTKPGKVSELKVSNNTDTTLLLSWTPPEGEYTDFVVKTVDDNKVTLVKDNVTVDPQLTVVGLPTGTRITLIVWARANHSLAGATERTTAFTIPGPVSSLDIVGRTNDSLTANWSATVKSYSKFIVTLQLDGEDVKPPETVQVNSKRFDGLFAATNYTVMVRIVSGGFEGPAVERWNFTKVKPPTDVKVKSSDKDRITLQWSPPSNTSKVSYRVQIRSTFWKYTHSETVNDTSYTFNSLRSGTKYDMEVRTVTDEMSDAVRESQFTVADMREISLSMLCSSATALLCDDEASRGRVFNQLKLYFKRNLGDDILWDLKKAIRDT